MANKKRIRSDKSPLIPVPDWKHADISVLRVGELQGQIAQLEEDAKNHINNVKKDLADKVKSRQDKITLHLNGIEAFATSHRDDFENQKSRKLNFGSIGWRKSTSISVKKNTLVLIKLFFRIDLQKTCIRINESVDKDAMAKLTDEQLASVKARRIEKDVFFVEPSSQKAANYG